MKGLEVEGEKQHGKTSSNGNETIAFIVWVCLFLLLVLFLFFSCRISSLFFSLASLLVFLSF